MMFKEYFRTPPSKAVRDRIVSEVGASPELFAELFAFMIREKEPTAWRVSWVLDYCDENNPGLILPHMGELITFLGGRRSEGLLRSCLRMLSRYRIPEAYQGQIADQCFSWLSREAVPVGLKVHSMQILANMAMEYPELKQELTLLIEDNLELNSAAFRARGTMVLKQMGMQNKSDR